MSAHEALIEEHEGYKIKYSKEQGVFSLEVWPCISSIIMYMISMKYVETIQQWRTCRDLVLPAFLITIIWIMVLRPIVCFDWSVPDDRGYKWNENWTEQVRFITRTLVTFTIVLFVTIAQEDFASFGFTLLEQFVFLAMVGVILYGIYIYILQIIETEF